MFLFFWPKQKSNYLASFSVEKNYCFFFNSSTIFTLSVFHSFIHLNPTEYSRSGYSFVFWIIIMIESLNVNNIWPFLSLSCFYRYCSEKNDGIPSGTNRIQNNNNNKQLDFCCCCCCWIHILIFFVLVFHHHHHRSLGLVFFHAVVVVVHFSM